MHRDEEDSLLIPINLQVWLGTLQDTSPDKRTKLLLKKKNYITVKHTTILGIFELWEQMHLLPYTNKKNPTPPQHNE